jgi:hypothetical protein
MTMSETSPRAHEPAELLYDHLMDLHGQAFDAERFEAAYHVLAAALHVAEELDDVERLSAIERLAANRQGRLDSTEPRHVMSSGSASVRGNTARFTALALTAKAARGRINADRATTKSRKIRTLPPPSA